MTLNTVAHLCYDETHVYAAFECGEPEMVGVSPEALWHEDIELFLMPVADSGDYFHIGVTPGGRHGAYWAGKPLMTDHTGIRVATRLCADAWLAEIAVPFAVMRTATPAPGAVWKVCLARARRGRGFSWPQLSGHFGFHDLAAFANLCFRDSPEKCDPAATDRKLFIRPVAAPMTIDGIIETEWQSAAPITAFVPLPTQYDRRLKETPSMAHIEKLMGGHYKNQGHTTALSREDLARARQLIAKQDWARSAFARILKIADHWLALSDDELYALIPVDSPMAYCVCYSYGCPTGAPSVANGE